MGQSTPETGGDASDYAADGGPTSDGTGEGETASDDAPDADEDWPTPPRSFVDEAGRTIEVRTLANGDREALVEMYDALDQRDRALGIPPATESGIRSWLDDVLADGLHLVACHDDRVVGHACLLPVDEHGHELAIFVASDCQCEGIGTGLLRTLLGYGRAQGISDVWLTVRRDNVVARSLYRSAGFERAIDREDGLAADVEMERSL